MLSEGIVLQSAGSLSVGVVSLVMMILQTFFFFKKPQLTWYAWSAAISFSGVLYSIGIFVEYNTPEGPLNRLAGLLEFTAIISLIHSFYGFTYSYLGIESRRYHLVVGTFHGIILVLLWFTPYLVTEGFVTRRFVALASPYVESAVGPVFPLFLLYGVGAGVYITIVWLRHKEVNLQYRIVCLTAGACWIALGIHDGLAVLGVRTFQYLMEYGFLVFATALLWIVFNNYLQVQAEEKYRVITEFSHDGIVVIQDGRIIFRNPACCDLTGLPLADSAARDLLDILAPEDRKKAFQHYRSLLQGGPTPPPITISILRSDGQRRFVEITSSTVQYSERPAALSSIRDITDRRRAEEIVRESEEKFRSMMEAMRDAIYICSPEWRVTYMNPSMIKMIGRDATGEICHKALFHRDDPCRWCGHESVQRGELYETDMVSPKDNRFFRVTHSPIFHKDGTISAMVIYRDVTVKKQLRMQLLRSDRLSATGQLAATIAHEINSPLQGITSLIHSIERTHSDDQRLLEKLKLVKMGFSSIRDTVKKLLDLNRPGKEARQSANINRVIEETVGLLKSHLEKNQVKIMLNLSSTIPKTVISAQQMAQVFMNVISNAVEAMAGISKSKDGSQTGEPIERKITVASGVRGDHIIIEVADTGPGISEADMERIFDPFYTRKKEMGMGIGLSLCHSIIEDHDGTISARNAPEGGAVFTVTLPIR